MWHFDAFNTILMSVVEYLLSQNKENIMPRINLTTIKNLEFKGKAYRVFDDKLSGFGVSVQKKSMSFIIQYRDKHRTQKYYFIGRVGKITPDEARKIAEKKFADIAFEQDPALQRQRDKSTMTVAQMCDWYMANANRNKRQSTISHHNSAIERHIKPLIGNMLITEVNRDIIERFVKDIECGNKIYRKEKSPTPRGRIWVKGGISAASHTLSFLGTIFEYAKQHGKIDKNPTAGIKRTPSNKKEIFMTLEEIRQFGVLLENPTVISSYPQAVNAIKLLLLTGCRRGEILSLKWDYINWTEQYLKFPETKTTKGTQIRPVGKGALQFMKHLYNSHKNNSPYVFPVSRESKTEYMTGSGLYKALKCILKTRDDNGNLIFNKPELDIHSLRHTFASVGEYLGKSRLLISALLGHKDGDNSITGRYIHIVDKAVLAAADDISETIKSALSI